jgi:DNA-directed RNA polymerase specialized sigma24 family protein
MDDHPNGEISGWIASVKAGDLAAAQPLWERYFGRMMTLARVRFRAAGAAARDASSDEEDAALSAFQSLCTGLVDGQYPQLEDRHDLWRLLVVITTRKVIAKTRRKLRQKRGGGAVRSATELTGIRSDADVFANAISKEPTPEFAALVADQYEKLLKRLGDELLRKVVVLRMEGYTLEEIASRLECSRRTVDRQLMLIRRILSAESDRE